MFYIAVFVLETLFFSLQTKFTAALLHVCWNVRQPSHLLNQAVKKIYHGIFFFSSDLFMELVNVPYCIYPRTIIWYQVVFVLHIMFLQMIHKLTNICKLMFPGFFGEHETYVWKLIASQWYLSQWFLGSIPETIVLIIT